MDLKKRFSQQTNILPIILFLFFKHKLLGETSLKNKHSVALCTWLSFILQGKHVHDKNDKLLLFFKVEQKNGKNTVH